ncbi:MAG TPA: MBOAT family O-acyltransferase, partial [Candidatus Sumerlaeota bacterium]|nr:MBOAT family O-acyltransferase [Candidatus Sumerlaeota bacterium]
LSLIFLSTLLDYWCSLGIEHTSSINRRKIYLWMSVAGNLGGLAFFKYYNFFAENLYAILNPIFPAIQQSHLNVILPVGISFYTFQTMSYTIDVYRNQMKACRSFLDFAVYVSFFPQLVAGPIERAERLLPQIQSPRKVTWDEVRSGTQLALWGLFKKLFVADNLAPLVNKIFADSAIAPPAPLESLLALYAFSFQIYCDFSGYSDIARGIARCMGISLMENFRIPYFATNPQDLWRRWHISLSTWLRDYLYVPLGGNRKGPGRTYLNLIATMLLGGLWHGASWMFVLWGAYHGLLLAAHRLYLKITTGSERLDDSKHEHIAIRAVRIFFMFHVTTFGWLLFRAQTVKQFVNLCRSLLAGAWNWTSQSERMMLQVGFFSIFLIALEAIMYASRDTSWIARKPWPVRALVMGTCLALLVFFSPGGGREFIYFQF